MENPIIELDVTIIFCNYRIYFELKVLEKEDGDHNFVYFANYPNHTLLAFPSETVYNYHRLNIKNRCDNIQRSYLAHQGQYIIFRTEVKCRHSSWMKVKKIKFRKSSHIVFHTLYHLICITLRTTTLRLYHQTH